MELTLRWVFVCGCYYAVSEKPRELQVMLDVVRNHAMKGRFRFNNEKSNTMVVCGKCTREYGSIHVSCGLIEEMYIWRYEKRIKNEGKD